VELIDKSEGVEHLRIEGIEEIVDQYKDIVDGLKKKNYDLLDFRRHEVLLSEHTVYSMIYGLLIDYLNLLQALESLTLIGT